MSLAVRISPSGRRQSAVAAAGAVVGAATAFVFLPATLVAGSAVLCAMMAVIAVEDGLRFRIPDPWVYGALVAGLAWSAVLRVRSEDGLLLAIGMPVVSAVLCGGVFLALREGYFRSRGFDGLGFGDVKLAAAGGAWLGWDGFAFAVLVAAVGALGFIGAARLRGNRWGATERLAFGAYLAPATWAVWFTTFAAAGG